MPILVPSTVYLLCVPAQKPKITESDVLAQTEIFLLDRVLLKVNIVTTGKDREKNIRSQMPMTPKNYTFISTLRSRGKVPGTGTLNACSTEKVVYYRRTGTGVPTLNTVQGLWRLLDGKTWSRQDKILNCSKEDKIS